MCKKIIQVITTFFMTITFLCYMMTPKVAAFGPSDETIYEGIDVSIYQRDIDFQKVKEAGIEIVYIRSSEGFSYVDSNFERNYEKAKENGLKVGFYHYVTARTEDEAQRQAQFFASVISGKIADCRIAMDFESFENLSNSEINSIGLVFLRTVERLTGKEMVVYSNAYTASNVWSGKITNYPLWIAQYEVNQPENNGTWDNWAGWQYTDEGIVNGIPTYVDRNKFTKEILISESTEIPEIEKPEENDNDPEQNTETITIMYGDTLSSLALKYNTTVAELVKLNNIPNPNLIYAGSSLIIPAKREYETRVYIVKSGDTLSKIAQKFNTTVSVLATDNNIQNVNLIYPGQQIRIKDDCKHDCGHTIYTVRRGDTLWSIARRYNTSIANIVRLNRIQNASLIYPGQMFRIK